MLSFLLELSDSPLHKDFTKPLEKEAIGCIIHSYILKFHLSCNANTTVNNMTVFIFIPSEVKDDFDWFAYLTEGEEDYVPPLDDSDSVIYCVSYSN